MRPQIALPAWSRVLSTWKPSSIPWGAAGMVALLVVVEAFVGRHWIDLTDPVSLSWRYSAVAAETGVRDCEVLCLGDSLVKHGLVPSVIERTSGTESREPFRRAGLDAPDLFACCAGRSIRGARPKALIINAKPAVLLGGPEFNARAWQEVLHPARCRRTAADHAGTRRSSRPRSSAGCFHRCDAGWRSNPPVLAAIARRDRPHSLDQSRPLAELVRQRRGECRSVRCLPTAARSTREVERQLYTDLFYVDPANAEAIERILKLAADRRIPLFWVLFPLSPKLQSLRDESGAEMLHDRFLKSIVARYPGTRHRARRPPRRLSGRLLRRCHPLEPTRGTRPEPLGGRSRSPLTRHPRTASSTSGWIALERTDRETAERADALEDIEESKRIVSAVLPMLAR